MTSFRNVVYKLCVVCGFKAMEEALFLTSDVLNVWLTVHNIISVY
jgi:hypothetical protein